MAKTAENHTAARAQLLASGPATGGNDAPLPDAELTERMASHPARARFDRDGGPSRVHVVITPKEDKTTITIDHVRLGDADEVASTKQWWRERLGHLKSWLEEAGNA